MATTPSIVNVSPAPDSSGIILKEQIVVTFDQEMDRESINDGTFVLMGPDKSTVFSPVDITPFDIPDSTEEEINSSPYVQGYIKGTISFSRIGYSGEEIDDSIVDTTGLGDMWMDIAIFTPDVPLEPNKSYIVILAGDETPTDNFDSGIRTRTVFDTERTAGSGTCAFEFYGGYSGTIDETFIVEFTSAGSPGLAEYHWWKASDPLTTYYGVSSTGERELEDGVWVTCGSDGSFAIGDKFSVAVKQGLVLPNNYRWGFTTGNGNIAVPPSTSSATGIDSITNSDGVSNTSFNVSSIVPTARKYGVPISVNPYEGNAITILFSDNLDSASVNGNLEVYSESANGDPQFFATGELAYNAEVSTNQIVITLDPGQLFENNIVVVRLGAAVMSDDGVQLGTEYQSYFSTPYSPLYTHIRRIQLDLGAIIASIPEETIMLAILEASLSADAITFVNANYNPEYFEFARRQYTTCLAELILVRGLMGSANFSDRMTKELGDLKVSRGGLGLDRKLNDLESCVAEWKVPLTTGGLITPGASLLPQVAVKGCDSYDAITVHRQWEPTSGIGHNPTSAGNRLTRAIGRRQLKTFRGRLG